MASLKFVPKVIFLPSLEVGVFLLLKAYLSSPEAPKNLEVRGRQSPRTLTLSCLRATPQCRRVFCCCFFWGDTWGKFNPFYRDSCNSKQPVITKLHHQITWYILHVCCFERTFQWPAPASEHGGCLMVDRWPLSWRPESWVNTPIKIDMEWNLGITQLKRNYVNHLNQTSIFGVHVNFPNCKSDVAIDVVDVTWRGVVHVVTSSMCERFNWHPVLGLPNSNNYCWWKKSSTI